MDQDPLGKKRGWVDGYLVDQTIEGAIPDTLIANTEEKVRIREIGVGFYGTCFEARERRAIQITVDVDLDRIPIIGCRYMGLCDLRNHAAGTAGLLSQVAEI